MLFVSILYYPLFSSPGLIFHGDEGWNLYFNSSSIIKDIVYAWANGSPNTSNSIPYYLLELPLTPFGSYIGNHVMVFLLAYLPGVTAYFSIYKTIKILYPDEKGMYIEIFPIIGSIFYLINWQNYGLTNPTLTWAFSYMILPPLTYLLIKIYKEMKIKDVLIFAIISTIGDPVPVWIYFMIIITIAMLVGIIIRNFRNKKSLVLYIKTTGYLVLFTFLANAYSLIETIAGFIYHAGGAYIKYGAPASDIVTAKNESFFNFIDVIMFGQSKFYSFGVNPQNWTPLNISILILAIFLIIFVILIKDIKTNVKHITILFALILFLSLFLAKGFNPPFGFLYKYVILLSPPGLVGITLDVEPWYILSALSYSFIYSIGVYAVILYIMHSKNHIIHKFKASSIKGIIVIFVLVILISTSFASILYTTNVELDSYTYPAFAPKFYPEPYINVTNYIESGFPDSYVTWIPYSGAYKWEDNYSVKNILTNLGGDLSEHFVNPTYLYPYLDRSNFTNFSTLLSFSDTKLLVLDTSGQLPQDLGFNETLNFLKNQTDLVQVYRSGWLYVFENTQNFSLVQSGIPTLNSPYPCIAGNSVIPHLSHYTVYENTSNPYYLAYLTGTILGNKNINIGWSGSYGSFVVYKECATNYMYNSNIFKIDSSKINGSNIMLNVTYNIPNILQSYNGNINGTFYSGFSPEIQLYPSNKNPEWVSYVDGGNNRAYLELNYKQHRINSTSGYIDFDIPDINDTSLYINYYGGRFTDISPLYYVASINKGDQFEEMPLRIEYNSNFSEYEKLNNTELISPYVIQVSEPEIVTGYINGIMYDNAILDDATYVQPVAVFQNVSLNTFNNIISKSNLVLDLFLNNMSKSNVFNGYPVNNVIFNVHNMTKLYFATPITGNYNITVKVLNGNISFLNYTLDSGVHRFTMHLNSKGSLVFNSSNASIIVNVNHASYQVESASIGEIVESNPVHYSFSYTSSNESLIIFKKTYSPLWSAYFNGKKYSPISLNGGSETGFLLPKGVGKVTIYYELQTYLDIGVIISILFFCFAVAFIIRRRE